MSALTTLGGLWQSFNIDYCVTNLSLCAIATFSASTFSAASVFSIRQKTLSSKSWSTSSAVPSHPEAKAATESRRKCWLPNEARYVNLHVLPAVSNEHLRSSTIRFMVYDWADCWPSHFTTKIRTRARDSQILSSTIESCVFSARYRNGWSNCRTTVRDGYNDGVSW